MALQGLNEKSLKPCTCPSAETLTPSLSPLLDAPKPEMSFDAPPSLSRPSPVMDASPKVSALLQHDVTHVYSPSASVVPDTTLNTSTK